MIIKKFENNEDWMEARRGKITGSVLKDIVILRGKEEKIGFYNLIAEKLAIAPDGENVMERGHRLEEEAILQLEKELGKTFNKELVIWEREDNNSIAISPDGYSEDLKEAVEVKCLASGRHLEALLKNEIPSEYEFQKLQYFIVNPELERLYFCFYDPRLSVKQFFYFTIERKEIQEDIDKYLEYQRKKLEEVEEIVKKLSF